MPSTDSTESWRSDTVDFLRNRNKIQTLAELTGVQHLRKMADELARNSEAEAAHVRKTVWGSEETTRSEDDMGTTILGDITHPPAVVVQQPQSNLWPIVAAGLAAMLPVAGLGAAGLGAAAMHLLSQPPAPTQPGVVPMPGFEDESVRIGLGRLEDYTLTD